MRKEPPLPNKVAEMLKLADCVAFYCRGRYRKSGGFSPDYFLVQMREGVPPRGSIPIESHGGWTYKQFADAVTELLES